MAPASGIRMHRSRAVGIRARELCFAESSPPRAGAEGDRILLGVWHGAVH